MTTIIGRQRQVTMEMSKINNRIDSWMPTAPLWQISKRRCSTTKLNSHLLKRMMKSSVNDKFSRATWHSICLIKWTKSTTTYSTSKCFHLITHEIAMFQAATIVTYLLLMPMAPNSYLCKLKKCSNQYKKHRSRLLSKYESRLPQTKHKQQVYNSKSNNFSIYWWIKRTTLTW